MKAYLIDPAARTVEQVQYSGDYHQIYELIGASTFDVAYINAKRDGLFVDDEGMLRDPETQSYFLVQGCPNPLAGKALCLGCNDEGESVAPRITLQELRQRVIWIDHHSVLKRKG